MIFGHFINKLILFSFVSMQCSVISVTDSRFLQLKFTIKIGQSTNYIILLLPIQNNNIIIQK